MQFRPMVVVLTAVLAAVISPVLAQDTALTYQGRLADGGVGADGLYDLSFGLWDAASGGSQVGATVSLVDVPVADGLFTVELDFGADAFDNTARWLEVAVEGSTLSPRQAVGRTPYAIQTRGIMVDDAEHVGIGVTPGGRKLRVWNLEGAAFEAFGTTGRAIEAITTEADMAILASNQDADGIGVYGQHQPTGNYGYLGSPEYGVVGRAPDTTNHWAGYFQGRGYFGSRLFVGREAPVTNAEHFGVRTPTSDGAYGGMYIDTLAETGLPFYGYATDGVSRAWHYYDGPTRSWRLYNGGTRLTVTDTGRVGVGTTSPSGLMHIDTTTSTDLQIALYVQQDRTVGGSNFAIYAKADGEATPTAVRADGGDAIGSRGIWASSDSVSGTAVLGRTYATTGDSVAVQGVCDSASGYDFYAAGQGINYGAASSRRWKREVEPIGGALGLLDHIRGVRYRWDAEHGGHRDIGYIAEEIGEVLPEIVAYEANGVDASGMDYTKIGPVLVEAIKELRAEKDAEMQSVRAEHLARLAEKDAEIGSLEARVARLEAALTVLLQDRKEAKR